MEDPLVKIELEAAEALAGLAHFPADDSRGSESVAERVKDESNDCNSSFDTFPKCSSNSHEGGHDSMSKNSEKPGILTGKSMKDEQNTELRLNPNNLPTNCASTGRKARQHLTEAELEARKIRRVLANRESARQTIRRRQAIFEELTRKAVDLAWENENLKREKNSASKNYDSLKTKNECLKAQMNKVMNVEVEETREESITTSEPTISASSTTNSPFIIYNQSPFLPFVWPSVIQQTNSVQLQCGTPAGIVFPPHIPINKPDSSSCEEGSSMTLNGTTSPLYLLPYPWVVTLPQNNNEQQQQQQQQQQLQQQQRTTHSFNLNDKPKETSSDCQLFFPEKVKVEPPSNGFPPDGGGGFRKVAMSATVSCEDLNEHNEDDVSEQIPVVCSGKRSCDTAAAAEARKRRKQLTRLKSHFHCRQLRMH